MSVTDLFPIDPSYPVERELDSNVLITDISGGQERRKLRSAIQRRSWDLGSLNITTDEFDLLNAFWQARQGPFDTFSYLPPRNHDRLIKALSVGTGNGSTVDFDLDNTDFFRRAYLGAGNRNVAYVDGSPVSATFSNDDGAKTSKVTYASAPGAATVLTVDIDRYCICRFGNESLKDSLLTYAYLKGKYAFREVARESI